ncbi:MAG TPA: glyoxalase superfamily protein [Steroidobacteraceae bacterium]|jgi:catechol 2,3-dioxygenase-like lactoylglutathione lyase family enzyme|nr:glyoxalase superfamily protein [Steroidobacteraceae bacterium]
MRTYVQAKAMAKSLRESLAARNVPLSRGECLEVVAKQFGFGSWNVLAAKIELESGAHPPLPQSDGVVLGQLLPVLRVGSPEAARAFYVEVLGFQWDWGGEDSEAGRAFYGQVSHGDLQMHLTTEPLGGSHPVTDVYFRMRGIDALRTRIAGKLGADRTPPIRDTFHDSRELAIEDPFGNLLRFVENNPPGVAAG